jgi:enoyl-CoA hydratase/carnithine racemase
MPNSVRYVFLDRPQKANALGSVHLEKLAAEFRALASDPDLRVVVLAGKGKTFCGGADVAELKSLNPETGAAFVGRIHEVCKAIRDLPVPVIAQLHGAVIGAGLEIAAACDLRVAAEGTKFAMPEVKLGIPSVVEAALLPRLRMGSDRGNRRQRGGAGAALARSRSGGAAHPEAAPTALGRGVARDVRRGEH